MKITVEKTSFLNAITVVMKGMSSRSTLPILSGIFMSAQNDTTVIIKSTDLEIYVKSELEALVEEYGDVVINGKLLFDIVKSLPDASITLSFYQGVLTISCLDSVFTLTTMNPEDFPPFPTLNALQEVEIETTLLAKMVKKVSKAVSRDETRAILTGILFTIKDKDITLVSTDSYRLAIAKESLEEAKPLGMELVIPGANFDEIIKLAQGYETLKIGECSNQIIFTFGNTTFITRKIEGNFPNYKQIIPKENKVSIKVNTSQLVNAIKRVSVLSRASAPVCLDINTEEGVLTISSTTKDVGEAKEKLAIEAEGESFVIGFNNTYITDGLLAVEEEMVTFEAQNPQKPGIIKSGENGEYFYLSMPVRIDNR